MSHNEEKDSQEESEEVHEAVEEPKTMELSDEDLEEVEGGDQSHIVNCQITD